MANFGKQTKIIIDYISIFQLLFLKKKVIENSYSDINKFIFPPPQKKKKYINYFTGKIDLLG